MKLRLSMNRKVGQASRQPGAEGANHERSLRDRGRRDACPAFWRMSAVEHESLRIPWTLGRGPWACAAAMLAAVALSALAENHPKPSTEAVRTVEMRGRVVCLAEEMHRLNGALLPTEHPHLWGFKTQDGTCYTLLRSKFSEAIFLDERIRQKDLLLKAKLFPQTQVIEVTVIRSIRDGVVQDLYYYCDVCAIKSVSPEICACCQGPVVLTEKPLREREE
jgi:hypothetical protein